MNVTLLGSKHTLTLLRLEVKTQTPLIYASEAAQAGSLYWKCLTIVDNMRSNEHPSRCNCT